MSNEEIKGKCFDAFEDMGDYIHFTGPDQVMDIPKSQPRAAELMQLIEANGSVEFGPCDDCPDQVVAEEVAEVSDDTPEVGFDVFGDLPAPGETGEHVITQEDLDRNPGLEEVVEVGETVEFQMATEEEMKDMDL